MYRQNAGMGRRGACRMVHVNPTDDEIRELLAGAGAIAMVGASSNPARPSHGVMAFLLERGFRVIPVNPHESEVHGRRAWPTLESVPEPVDIVDVFRRPEFTPAIAGSAVEIGARVLWLQVGVINEEAAARAKQGGLVVVMDRCMAQVVKEQGLGVRA
jgi:predicted CoA-binding protein